MRHFEQFSNNVQLSKSCYVIKIANLLASLLLTKSWSSLVKLELSHAKRPIILSSATSSSRLAKIPFLRQHPGQARRYSLSERARARTVVAGARSCLRPGVTSSRGYVSVCPRVRAALTIFPRSGHYSP